LWEYLLFFFQKRKKTVIRPNIFLGASPQTPVAPLRGGFGCITWLKASEKRVWRLEELNAILYNLIVKIFGFFFFPETQKTIIRPNMFLGPAPDPLGRLRRGFEPCYTPKPSAKRSHGGLGAGPQRLSESQVEEEIKSKSIN
jgi:hypothetical protein